MAEIGIIKLNDGRTIEYYTNRPELGGIIIEPFYLGVQFSDTDILMWVKVHKNIRFIAFAVGAILSGERLIDQQELESLLSDCMPSADQFFNEPLRSALGA